MSIRYPNAIWDDKQQRISDAEAAEIAFATFTDRRAHEQITARLTVRQIRRLDRTTALTGQDELFAAYWYPVVSTDSPSP